MIHKKLRCKCGKGLGKKLDYDRDIDKNIHKLVKWLNSIPGVETETSCGGHKNPKRGQNEKDEFSIEYIAMPDIAPVVVYHIFNYVNGFEEIDPLMIIRTSINVIYFNGRVIHLFKGRVDDFDRFEEYWDLYKDEVVKIEDLIR